MGILILPGQADIGEVAPRRLILVHRRWNHVVPLFSRRRLRNRFQRHLRQLAPRAPNHIHLFGHRGDVPHHSHRIEQAQVGVRNRVCPGGGNRAEHGEDTSPFELYEHHHDRFGQEAGFFETSGEFLF